MPKLHAVLSAAFLLAALGAPAHAENDGATATLIDNQNTTIDIELQVINRLQGKTDVEPSWSRFENYHSYLYDADCSNGDRTTLYRAHPRETMCAVKLSRYAQGDWDALHALDSRDLDLREQQLKDLKAKLKDRDHDHPIAPWPRPFEANKLTHLPRSPARRPRAGKSPARADLIYPAGTQAPAEYLPPIPGVPGSGTANTDDGSNS